MSTSRFKGLIRHEDAQWDAYSPVDAAWSRGVMSNVMHSADSCGQVLANWRVLDSVPNMLGREVRQGATWYVMWASPELPVRVRGDGSSYPLRVRVRGAGSDAGGAVDFAIAIHPAGAIAEDPGPDGATWWTYGNVAGSTPAWVSLASPTIQNFALTRDGVTSTLKGIADAPVGLRYSAARVVVYARFTSGTLPAIANLSGVYAAEYIGL
ncbi:MAG: hypothetical protein MUE69_29125 [Myxococcota bacterium]|jgi:hypothetical protein|nr:hypothetical protein [Myxococcota bacterium]